MKTGEIVINGNVGMHLGDKMVGGKITVNGNAGQWVGGGMKNGLIEIHGDAGRLPRLHLIVESAKA